MSHITAARAPVSHHAVVRYATRVLWATVPDGMADRDALAHVRAQGIDCAWVRSRLAQIGGIVIASGATAGTVLVHEEGMKVRVAGGSVVTVLTPPPRAHERPAHALSLGVRPAA